MRSTPYHHYALYEPEAAPDLTESGEYNSAVMGIDADMHAEETERKEADAELASSLAAETQARTDADAALDTAYKAADNALSLRIDDAEGEISYLQSEDWYNFAQSPETHTYLKEDYEQMLSRWPKCYMLLNITDGQNTVFRPVFWPIRRTDTHVYLRAVLQTKHNNVPGFMITEVRVGLNEDGSVNVTSSPYFIPLATWETLTKKPFSTIGPGLKVVDAALTVDMASLPVSINANTTFGDLTSGVTA